MIDTNKNKNNKKIMQFNEQIRRNIANIIHNETIFEEIRNKITIIKAISTKDLKLCKIYFRTDNKKITNIIESALNLYSKQIAHQLPKYIHIRTIPTLKFYIDETPFILEEIKNIPH